ncbi:hypothetical protein LTR50_005558 [Elasticomyces elasticus]|nr:hypothetical protein LTR50_005558 [Elasticomyces elasticus]
MALSTLLDTLPMYSHLSFTLLFLIVVPVLATFLYRLIFHPLSRIPGPFLAKVTSLYLYYHSYRGDECTLVDRLHQRYGPVIRIAPNEVSVSDGAALAPVHTERGGFMKAECYRNFDIDGHPSIFSALDPAHRAVRSKAVVSMFSTSAIRAGTDVLEGCVGRLVDRMKAEAGRSRQTKKETGEARRVNVLNLSRSLAVDAVSAYLFNQSFGGIEENDEELSASQFVNAFVAVGRFFYLPNWAFSALELASAKIWPSKAVDESMEKMDRFVSNLVEEAANGGKRSDTYQGRLLHAGISKHETAAQCKDLIFAGTDSTGMNLGTICWHLARDADIYQSLRDEIRKADAEDKNYNPQSLPYLRAVMNEGLRLSMANPTRLPRVVPATGWSFHSPQDDKQTYFPAGAVVGLQIYSLHHNPAVFPDPFRFLPDRWLAGSDAETQRLMQRDFIPFGIGPRQCIARNLATAELYFAVRRIVREDVLKGAKAVGEKIEIMEWFNSKVVGEKIELFWDGE